MLLKAQTTKLFENFIEIKIYDEAAASYFLGVRHRKIIPVW